MANQLTKCILAIDDEEILLKTVKDILGSHGYKVLLAQSGEEGLEIARKEKPDLVILDILMPGMKGREVCKRLKEDKRTQDIPVIFLTAKESADDITAEWELGAAAHLIKPVKPEPFIRTIDNILRPKS